MKKALVLALAVIMMVTVFTGCKPAGTTGSQTGNNEPSGMLIVGGNAINADMFAGWSNLVSNSNIKSLINGYGTIAYTDGGEFIVDQTVVKTFDDVENADGSWTYTFEINQNLKFNDGTQITAKDYVFNMLFSCYPGLYEEMDCDRFAGMDVYNGSVAYNEGETDVFTGVRLLGDYSFSITVDAETDGMENYPDFYAITYASVGPLPMHVLAPGCDIVDDGNGTKITGDFGIDLLRTTLDTGSDGYRYNPTVSCGPYSFISYDDSAQQAVLELNPYFVGTYDGSKPMIKTLIVKLVADATAIDELSTGSVDLLIQLSGQGKINPGLDLVEEGKAAFSTYSRNGYGKITFKCDVGPTQFEEVRRAIAYCLDREEFAQQWTGGFGIIVHSRYGVAQWVYQMNEEFLEENMNVYPLNIEKAKEELVNGGWIYDDKGGAYVEGAGKIRHKKLDDGTYMPLVIEWFSPNSNDIGQMLNGFIVANAESIGFKFNQTFGDNAAFSDALYSRSETPYNMINGGVGFGTPDSPWYYYDPAMPPQYNQNVIDDPILYSTSQDMKRTESGDRVAYAEKWQAFTLRFNEILPDIPLYSDEYYDFYNPKLQNYNPTAIWPWYEAIINATVSE